MSPVIAAPTTVRWAILGTGKIADVFASALPRSSTGRLVAVGSRSEAAGRRFASLHGAERHYGTYAEAIADPYVDAVYVATPHTTHLDLLRDAARAGKHVLCEKPLTVTSEQARLAVTAAREGAVVLMEGFAFRYHSQTRRVLTLIHDGAIGEVRAVEASFGYDAGPNPGNYLLRRDLAGGSILDVGCYPIAMARLIAGAIEGRGFAEPSTVTGAGLIDERTGVDLRARATMTFDSGMVADVSCAISQALPNSVTIWGSAGVLTLSEPWLPGPSRPASIALRTRDGQQQVSESTGEPLYAAEADELARSVERGESGGMPLDDTLGNMLALDRWRASIGLRFDEDGDGIPLLTPERPNGPKR
jgi:predicted dehydrogenase